MALRTRPPTGKIPPPVILLEGEEGAGKSWAAAELSASDKVGRTVWLQVGTENTADEYSQIPGVRYEIVDHDGTWHDIYGQVVEAKDEAARAKAAGEKPLVLVIDQIGAIWELLSEWAHNRAKGSKSNRQKLAQDPNAEIDVTPNYWTDANERWRRLMTALLTFPGVVVILARGRETALIDANGRPVAGKKDYRVEGQKSMAFDVPVWVRMTRGGNPVVVKLRSVHGGVKPGDRPRPLPGFSLEKLIFELLRWDPQTGGERALAPMQAGDEAPESARFKAFMVGVETADLDELRRMWRQHVPAALDQGEISEAEADKVREAIMAAKADLEAQQPPTTQAMARDVGPSDAQHRRMHALWRELGLGGDEHREDRLVQTAGFIGREVTSSKELTPEEADAVIAALDQRAKGRKAEKAEATA